MLKEAISGLQDHDENHMNHHEQAETQRGVIGNSQQIFPLVRINFHRPLSFCLLELIFPLNSDMGWF